MKLSDYGPDKSASELVCDQGDAATWYVAPLAGGRFLAWESASEWFEMCATASDARAAIDRQQLRSEECLAQMEE